MNEWQNRFSITGKRVLVTGASKGIGYTTSIVLADAGADIVIVGRDKKDLETLQEKILSMGRRCISIAADLASIEGVDKIGREAIDAFAGIDILVNNAGIALLDPLLEAKVEDWENTMNVNLRAPFLLARHLVPGMIERGKGKIINLSSQSGVNALDDHGAYCTSKGGLNMLTKVMASEWAKYNIQTNAICPNVILTPMGEKAWGDPKRGGAMKAKTPARRFGTPIEVADMVLYLASDASNYVCGEILMIDGGYTAI
jgi:2-deoxy-D-gluconate 3-dehydrogenase